MKKYLGIIFIGLFCVIKSQQSFEIKGKIMNVDNEEILFSNVFIPVDYYEKDILKTKTSSGNFSLKNNLSYPQAYRLIIGQNMSGLVFVDKGIHSVKIISDSLSFYYPLILNNSKINTELKNKFLPLYKKFIDKDLEIFKKSEQCSQDSLNIDCKKMDFELYRKTVHIQQDSIIYEYAKRNPESYIPLWFIADKLNTFGFSEYQDKAFQILSKNIRETKTGVELEKSLNIAKYFGNGKLFPKINLKPGEISTFLGKKYTLIDFWFSYCAPCLQQMPTYKNLYDHYKSKGFEIIGISTDRTQDIENWNKVIQDKKLDWKQLLDENGIESKKYGIAKFPTNFLLDSEGKIIKKDISPIELAEFLEENLQN